VANGHLTSTGEATTLTDGPVFINESASTAVIDGSSASSGSGTASDATSGCVSRVAGGSAVVSDDVMSEARRSDQLIDTCVSTTMSVNELSPLKYVSARVANDNTKENKVLFALCDRGAEICCLDAGLATDLAPNIVGQIQLRPDDNAEDSVLDDNKPDDNINVPTVDDNCDVTNDNDDKTSSDIKSDDIATSSDDSVASKDGMVWYGIVGFNIPLDTV